MADYRLIRTILEDPDNIYGDWDGKENQKDDYPCSGHECYDRGNYHASCVQCEFYYKKDGVSK